MSPRQTDAPLREVYAGILELRHTLHLHRLATAELVKVSANAFLATKISFINAISEVCEAVGRGHHALATAWA